MSFQRNLRQPPIKPVILVTTCSAYKDFPLNMQEFLSNHNFQKINFGKVNQQDLIKEFFEVEKGHKECELIIRE